MVARKDVFAAEEDVLPGLEDVINLKCDMIL
jgi:hypothetical protein